MEMKRGRLAMATMTLVLGTAFLALAGPTAASASAAAGPVVAGLTITPTVTVVGGQVTVVATATNTSSAPVRASLGLENPNYANQAGTGLRGTAGCTPRNLHRLIYCGIQSLAPGATASITLTLSASAPGTDQLTTYARITYTTDDTFAYGTLTIR